VVISAADQAELERDNLRMIEEGIKEEQSDDDGDDDDPDDDLDF
jgi:vacuolar-type H+-ATPase subunit C/Vma6